MNSTAIKSIAIFAPRGGPLTSVSGPLEMLALANSLVAKEQRLHVSIVSENAQPLPCLGGLELQGASSIEVSRRYDCIVIGAIGQPNERSLNFDPKTLVWLRQQHQQGARLVSVCTGAFLLAATGVLDGVSATTHWATSEAFQRLYPKVRLDCSQMITRENDLWCSGGASSYQDITLMLIRNDYGDLVAEQVAKLMLIDLDRISQLKYMHFMPSRQHQDTVIHQVQDALEQQWKHASVAGLAEGVHLSERQFKRRFKQATGKAPLEYLQALRIEQAKRLLSKSNDSVEQIALSVGYEDVRFFRKLFKRTVGVAPSEYRDQSVFHL